MTEQKPSVGRIMLYQHPGSSDGHFAPTVSPAIVQAVHDDGKSVDVWVFGPKGIHIDRVEVGEPGELRKVSWPPRV